MANDSSLGQIERITVPLLRSLETLGLIGRYLDPPELASMLETVGHPDRDLHIARSQAEPWPERYAALGAQLDAAADQALAAFDGLRAAATDPGAVGDLFRAMRHVPRALEALYPLAGILPPINRFFLDPARRTDEALQARFLRSPAEDTGVMCISEDPEARDAVWAYVPETYSPDVAHPLVMCLHGGSGRGRSFLWSWVRDARTHGAIVIAPTAVGQTWAIQGTDADSPRLFAFLSFVRQHWNVDAKRMLLTGMSDGGTFTYVSGLDAASPFTHLAPVSAAFHPLLVQMADEQRPKGLPIHIIHGVRDWMFPVAMARDADRYFKAAGATVTYREAPDLSHTYPADMNGAMLDWLMA